MTCGAFGKFKVVDSSKLLHETDSFNEDVGVVVQVGGISVHHFSHPIAGPLTELLVDETDY